MTPSKTNLKFNYSQKNIDESKIVTEGMACAMAIIHCIIITLCQRLSRWIGVSCSGALESTCFEDI